MNDKQEAVYIVIDERDNKIIDYLLIEFNDVDLINGFRPAKKAKEHFGPLSEHCALYLRVGKQNVFSEQPWNKEK